jgi:hypothetical protein
MAVSKSSFMTPTLRKNGATAIAQQFCPRSIGGDDAIRACMSASDGTTSAWMANLSFDDLNSSLMANDQAMPVPRGDAIGPPQAPHEPRW